MRIFLSDAVVGDVALTNFSGGAGCNIFGHGGQQTIFWYCLDNKLKIGTRSGAANTNFVTFDANGNMAANTTENWTIGINGESLVMAGYVYAAGNFMSDTQVNDTIYTNNVGGMLFGNVANGHSTLAIKNSNVYFGQNRSTYFDYYGNFIQALSTPSSSSATCTAG